MSGAYLRLRACLFELDLGARGPQVWLCWCGSAWLVAGSGPRHFHWHICDEACVRLGRCLVEISIKNLRGLVHWIVASALSRWRDVALAGGVNLFRQGLELQALGRHACALVAHDLSFGSRRACLCEVGARKGLASLACTFIFRTGFVWAGGAAAPPSKVLLERTLSPRITGFRQGAGCSPGFPGPVARLDVPRLLQVWEELGLTSQDLR